MTYHQKKGIKMKNLCEMTLKELNTLRVNLAFEIECRIKDAEQMYRTAYEAIAELAGLFPEVEISADDGWHDAMTLEELASVMIETPDFEAETEEEES
jgi:hypothetical protein